MYSDGGDHLRKERNFIARHPVEEPMYSNVAGEARSGYKIGMATPETKTAISQCFQGASVCLLASLLLLISAFAPLARGQQFSPVFSDLEHSLYHVSLPFAQTPPATTQGPQPRGFGSVTGRIVDVNGAPVAGAHVKLSRPDSAAAVEVLSDDDGQFRLTDIETGPFQLTISAPGFADQQSMGMVRPGEALDLAQITLPMPTYVTQVQVVLPRAELAEAEMKAEEHQRESHAR
jgi:hypothetical protein